MTQQVQPEIGLDATMVFGYGQIRRAGTISDIARGGKSLTIRRVNVRGVSTETVFTLRKDGIYRERGNQAHYATSLVLGVADEYMEPGL